MAKVTLIIEDMESSDGKNNVAMSSSVEDFVFTGDGPLPGSLMFGIAIKNLFQGQWLAQNADKILADELNDLQYETMSKEVKDVV